MATNPKIVIDVKNLTRSYDLDGSSIQILKGVSLQILKGEMAAIMGPSGSGKSTLMHILGLLDRPSGGEYYFNGKDTQKLNDDELARFRNQEIGFVFQSFNLLARTTVLDNVKLPLSYSGIKKSKKEEDEKAKSVIASVGLSHRLENWPSQLSGGEQQRVAIARALICNPSVIFADEPTGNLDSKSGEQIMGLLHDLHKQGRTIVLVSHDMNVAEQAERIIKIKDGLIAEAGKV
jgi:putative ABC transport system ATP-binding protein